MERPAWVDDDLYPFADRWAELSGGTTIHYVDEGAGTPILMVHGNPTWSFLYRDIVRELTGDFRCVAVDLPGFGLSSPAPGYGFTPAEHADVLEQLVLRLDLRDVTMVVQDWGGPIGFAVAARHPERFAAFVIGNTWAWPKEDLPTQLFSRLLGGPVGRRLIAQRNLFVERILPAGVRRATLSHTVMEAYRGPFPTPASRRPTAVLPREILGRPFLAEVERGLARLRDRPALIVWPTADVAFGERERRRWEGLFPEHRTVLLRGAGHYMQEDAAGEIVAAIRDWRAPDRRGAPRG
jgi:haloalkane dehalogenase